MASLYICEHCGKDDPEFFLLSEDKKVPVCNLHIGDYALKHNTFGCPFFPISAFDFMERSSDFDLYKEREKNIGQAGQFLDRFLTEETEQLKDALVRIRTMEEDTIQVVQHEFESFRKRLENWNSMFQASIQGIRVVLKQASHTKVLESSSVVSLLFQLIHQYEASKPDFFSCVLQPISGKIKRIIKSCSVRLSPDLEKFLNLDLTNRSSDVKQETEASFNLCRKCSKSFGQNNYFELAGHEGCAVCFSCIEEETRIEPHCPACKCSYSQEVKETLNAKIQSFCENSDQEQEERHNNVICANCQKEMEKGAHVCINGDQICLFCCQNRIISDSLGGTANCPECNIPFPQEVFDAFNDSQKRCSICENDLILATVRHRCIGIENKKSIEPGMSLVCALCVALSRQGDQCGKCGRSLKPQTKWGSSYVMREAYEAS